MTCAQIHMGARLNARTTENIFSSVYTFTEQFYTMCSLYLESDRRNGWLIFFYVYSLLATLSTAAPSRIKSNRSGSVKLIDPKCKAPLSSTGTGAGQTLRVRNKPAEKKENSK